MSKTVQIFLIFITIFHIKRTLCTKVKKNKKQTVKIDNLLYFYGIFLFCDEFTPRTPPIAAENIAIRRCDKLTVEKPLSLTNSENNKIKAYIIKPQSMPLIIPPDLIFLPDKNPLTIAPTPRQIPETSVE